MPDRAGAMFSGLDGGGKYHIGWAKDIIEPGAQTVGDILVSPANQHTGKGQHQHQRRAESGKRLAEWNG
jgi:hypothetical protein